MPTALGERANRGRAPTTGEAPPEIETAWRSWKERGCVASRNQLIRHYMTGHVRPIAARLHMRLPTRVDMDDLVQQGYLGLVDAMERFEIHRETRFETFSRRRIVGAMQDYLRAIDPVPRLMRSRGKRLLAATERFRGHHGRPPTDEELRPLVDLPEPVYRAMRCAGRAAAMVPFSSVGPEGATDGESDGDAMHGFEDLRQPGPSHSAERLDLRRWLTRGLDPRDRLIMILYYYEHLTMAEVGRAIGISESRVSQRLESIVACLRARVRSRGTEIELEFHLGRRS